MKEKWIRAIKINGKQEAWSSELKVVQRMILELEQKSESFEWIKAF